MFGCKSNACEHEGCRRQATSKRALRSGEILGKAGAVPWLHVVLTFPEQALPALAEPETLKRCRTAATKTVKIWAAAIARDNGYSGLKIGGLIIMHPSGKAGLKEGVDAGPADWRPHFHILIPCAGRVWKPCTKEVGEWVKFGHWIRKGTLARLREYWSLFGYHALGSDMVDALEPMPGKWVVHVTHKVKPEQKAHVLRYNVRTFPWWVMEANRISYFGAFGCAVLRRVCRGHGIDSAFDDEFYSYKGVCPDCGKPYSPIAVRGPPSENDSDIYFPYLGRTYDEGRKKVLDLHDITTISCVGEAQ